MGWRAIWAAGFYYRWRAGTWKQCRGGRCRHGRRGRGGRCFESRRRTRGATKAAAAANERRALDVRTPSKEPGLLEESGGGARLMDGEGFSGGA